MAAPLVIAPLVVATADLAPLAKVSSSSNDPVLPGPGVAVTVPIASHPPRAAPAADRGSDPEFVSDPENTSFNYYNPDGTFRERDVGAYRLIRPLGKGSFGKCAL